MVRWAPPWPGRTSCSTTTCGATFVDLAVFAGPFDAAAAAAVCGTDPAAMAPALAQLVERSLLTRTPSRRYVMLETLRAFGAERLAEDGRGSMPSRERHARHFVELGRRRAGGG